MADKALKIPDTERARHIYCIGSTGAGKSEILKTLIYQSIAQGKCSIVVLDPKNDLVQDVSRFIEHTLPDRQGKLIYLSPFDFPEKTFVLNPLQLPQVAANYYEEFVDISTKELTRTLQNIFREMDSAFTGLMESVLAPCIETLLRKGDADFRDLHRFMDNSINGSLVELGLKSPNEAVRRFFTYDFPNLSQATKDGIKWRTRTLLQSQMFSRVTTGKSTVNLYELVNTPGNCILFNLNKGKLSADVSSYLGKFIVSMLQVIAQQRGGLQSKHKLPIHCYLDEFQNFTTKSIKDILAESRSNMLYLVLAQQVVGQGSSDRDFIKVLMENTRVKILGQSSSYNIEALAGDFQVNKEILQKIPKHHFYVKVGHGAAVLVKGWSGLVGSKHSMSHTQWKETVERLLKKYYVSNSSALLEKREQEEQRKPLKEAKSTVEKRSHLIPNINNIELPEQPLYPLD